MESGVGSSRVGSTLTIVPFTVHFVLQYEGLEQAMLSLDKLLK